MKKFTIQRSELIVNWKKNWFFPISAMAFFCLTLDNDRGYFIGLLFVFAAMLAISAKVPSTWSYANGHALWLKLFCGISALGICLGNQAHFYEQTQRLLLPEKFNTVFLAVSFLGAVVGLYFVYVCLIFFWSTLLNIWKENQTFSDITKAEYVVYGLLISLTLALTVFAFFNSNAFYGSDVSFDVIYTSDSGFLVQRNAYLALSHPENDLRQPLFAVFTAPFVAIPYLLGRLSFAPASVQAMLVNAIQVVMLFAAHFMVTKMLDLTPVKRVCFMLLSSLTYPQLLFSLMMEQYISAYFYLILCLYLISKRNRPDRLALWGAGSTLLPSMILLPFMSQNSPFKNFKGWFTDMLKYGLEFVALMLAFCRFDILLNLPSKLFMLSAYTGKAVPFSSKIYQYTAFIRNCFTAPDAGVDTKTFEHVSWQLNAVDGVDFIGVALLLAAVISLILNRKQKTSLLAAGWIAFSAVLFVGLGWGTMENGLILYSLYFAWAFLVLLFQLAEKIENKLNIKFLVPVLSIGVGATVAIINVPMISEMIRFAITYYPV